jgi:hypothetical protein
MSALLLLTAPSVAEEIVARGSRMDLDGQVALFIDIARQRNGETLARERVRTMFVRALQSYRDRLRAELIAGEVPADERDIVSDELALIATLLG